MKAASNFEPMILWCRPHPSLHAKSSCSNSLCNGDILTQLERQIYHQTMIEKEQTLPLASLEARWPAEQACRNARHLRRSLELENASLWPLGSGNLVCAHGTTILTNRESSELVGERIFHALQVRMRTI